MVVAIYSYNVEICWSLAILNKDLFISGIGFELFETSWMFHRTPEFVKVFIVMLVLKEEQGP